MPTPPTNLTSESAAASIAALDGALSEKQAVGPPAASPRHIVGLFRRYWLALQERRRRHRLRATLCTLSERELIDIGVTRAEIDCIAAQRALDRLKDGTTHLGILSRSVM